MVTGTAAVFGMAIFVGLQRLWELRRSAVNASRLLARGASEFGAGHYPLFFLLHGGWLAGWVTEALVRGPALSPAWPAWLGLFVAAQALRYWCILTLGPHWTTRVFAVPGASRIRRGPYRLFAHPNYFAVGVELGTLPLVFDAWLTAMAGVTAHTLLILLVRLPAERTALALLRK